MMSEDVSLDAQRDACCNASIACTMSELQGAHRGGVDWSAYLDWVNPRRRAERHAARGLFRSTRRRFHCAKIIVGEPLERET